MYKIDCHSHFFEPFIAEGISKILRDNNIKENKTIAVLSKIEFLTAEERLRVMDRDGVDATIIDYQIVWQHYDETKYPVDVRVALSRFINSRLAEVARKYPDRYIMMADIPLLNVDAGIEELNRCYELGARGLCLNTNVNGKPLTSPDFQPFWIEANRLGLPVFLHPRSNLSPERISQQHSYHTMVGYPFDTTIAGIDFLMDDFFSKYSRINVMLCHCGGALPFIKKRLHKITADNAKLSSLLSNFFYDTAVSSPHQLEFTIDEVGLNQMCYGSDYPYHEFRAGIETIEMLELEDTQKEKIFNGNARRFFGMN